MFGGIATDANGCVYIADWQRVQVQGVRGNCFCLGAAKSEGAPEFRFGPRGIAINRSGVVFVTDMGPPRVLRWWRDGRIVAEKP
jgi:hypothetical protein